MKCSVYIAASLDGFIARSDGGIDWLSFVEREGEDYGYRAFHDTVDTVVVGRSTYNLALGFDPWPYVGKRCVVLTHAPPAPRHGETFYSGSPHELCARLAAEGAEHAYVDGGAVIQQFLSAGLVTDLIVSFIPVLLGEGIRLFGSTGGDLRLELTRTNSFASGLVQVAYRVIPRSVG
jgi:dihydrofolate reductase